MPPGILCCNSECPIHPKTAIFNRPIQGGFAHQIRYARVQPGHSVYVAFPVIVSCSEQITEEEKSAKMSQNKFHKAQTI